MYRNSIVIKMLAYLSFLLGMVISWLVYQQYIIKKLNDILDTLEDLSTPILRISYMNAELADQIDKIKDVVACKIYKIQYL